MELKIGNVVILEDGRIGKIYGEMESGELILESGRGGQISYFKVEDVKEIKR